ncbi:hypothetical protein HNQ80_003898 [Anaerosolibacter carboniphilus]|uniref:Lipoprotein n=1 Tax=Anaerosolibacter carboniphilus TaxID=1417629 RepID=A0A841L648_9FIRM|nr:hypothetical protein [Anaerosolibacter carboniphilus]MBB6217775.1 hypothetical protein [Anaerosolibacter carboniphilus]
MKKIIVIIITLIVILTGCSDKKNSGNNTETAPLSNNQLSQSQSENTSQSANDTNSSTDSNMLDSIDTANSPFEKGYYDYQGTISNDMSIQMSIYPLGKDMVGSYFYESQRKEMNLKGKAGEKEIILYEYDETGKKTGIFKGTMNAVDKIEGTWTSTDNKKSYPFILSLKSNLPGVEYGKRYGVATGTTNDQDVENFVSKIQGYVINDNKEQLAKEIQYPITVKINDKATTIQNKDDFIKNYDKIFYPNYKQVMSNAFTKYMFANWKGIMFGTGSDNIWINEVTSTNGNPKLMITAINN